MCHFSGMSTIISLNTYGKIDALQQKVFLYAKWFQWSLTKFIIRNEQDLMGM
jgi:hypothetical protein